MSRIGDLMAQMCPGGIQFRYLRDCTLRNVGGGTPSRARADYWNGTIPWASVGDVSACTLRLAATRQTITDLGLDESSSNLIPAGYVVVAVKINPGAMRVVERDVAINQDIRGLLLRDELDPHFLAYYFKTLRLVGNGTIVKGITNASLEQVRVPVPPLEIQREIVKVLDQFTELEARLEAELEAEKEARRRQYEHYRLSVLNKASHDAVFVAIGDLGRVVTGRTPKSSDPSAWGSDVDFITPTDIKNGLKVVSKPVRRLSRAGAGIMEKALVPAGSLLVTCIGADMGKTVINANVCVTNQQINSIIPTSGVDVGYMFHILTSMRHAIRTQGERGGGTMPIINKTDFSKIKLPVPPVAIQKEVAVKLDELDVLVDDLSADLPTELRARRHQYEYYRDQLLTFEELPA